MATPRAAARPLAAWKSALRQARFSKVQRRCYADLTETQPDYPHPEVLQTEVRQPSGSSAARQTKVFVHRAHHANGLVKQNSKLHSRMKTYPPPPTATAKCKDPVAAVTASQLTVLDPSGVRGHLFSKDNREGARVGDILLVRQKNGDPFAGVCLNIRRRGVDTAILLRNQLTRVGVEMWYKIYSPNVQGIELVKRREKRARRARLYYMRKPRHDLGSVEGIVRQYQRQSSLLKGSGSARGKVNASKKKSKKR